MDPSDFSATLKEWQTFYFITATAGATLTGLMFVAVTFGATRIDRISASVARPFIDPSLNHFLWTLIIGTVMNIPTLISPAVGLVLLSIGAVRLFSALTTLRKLVEINRKQRDFELGDWSIHVVLPLSSHMLLIGAACGFALSQSWAFMALAIANLLLLFTGIQNAWDQLIWMAFEGRPNGNS